VESARLECNGGNRKRRKSVDSESFKNVFLTKVTENRAVILACLAHRVKLQRNVSDETRKLTRTLLLYKGGLRRFKIIQGQRLGVCYKQLGVWCHNFAGCENAQNRVVTVPSLGKSS